MAAARRCTTSTATSTWTCTAGTARPGRPRPPGDRRGGPRPGRPRHPFRPADRGRAGGRGASCRRFGLPLWRFANSGTEATMDAVHLMRAITGRDLIIKVEGCYHGHHDSVQVSVRPRARRGGPGRTSPAQAPASTGIPDAIVRADARRAASTTSTAWPGCSTSIRRGRRDDHRADHDERGDRPPRARLPAALKDLLHAHGALLTFDEVKTGLTAGPGGATGLTGVTPDITCLAKSIGGGIAVRRHRRHGRGDGARRHGDYEQVGTFNGNPLAMAAARAMLCEVGDRAGLRADRAAPRRAVAGLELQIARDGLAAHVVSAGRQGMRGLLAPSGARLPGIPGRR